ncbi:MAG: hypothetical protein ACLUV3_03690 [Oscillospiraceae bacterium]
MDIKIICYKDNCRKNQIIKAINILNSVQNYFFYKLINTDVDVVADEIIDWDSFSNTNGNTIDEYTIFITEKPFIDNWFSHEDYKFSIITTDSWEVYFAPPSLCAYLVYQIAQATVSFEADLSENMEMRMVHDKAEGCMFDFCFNKPDIKLGMVAGTICPQCRSVLLRYGIKERALNAIERILLYVRSEAIGKPVMFNENEAFIVMRFSSNDENDHAYKYGIQPALKDLSIKCLRADDKVISGQLLQKVRQSIEKCRFIIAKVDSDNLNVYFELGLAMGLDKDVLLISEEDLVMQLPSDLKNWECLTYPKGNYEELRRRIIKYYQDNYHH